MARVTIKKPPPPNARKFLEAARDAAKPHFDKQVREREAVVKDWSDSVRPEFKAREIFRRNNRELSMFVAVTNGRKSANRWGYTIGQIWRWYDQTGQKAHTIPSRTISSGGTLKFVLRKPSLPSAQFPRRLSVGDPINIPAVWHPGTKPAGTGAEITDRFADETIQAMERALGAAIKTLDARITR